MSIFVNLWQFLQNIWESFLSDLSLFEQVIATLALVGSLTGFARAVRHQVLGKNKSLIMELADEKEASRKWLKKFEQADKALEQAQNALPETWMEQVKYYRKDGSNIIALGRLRDNFNNADPHIAVAADELTGYHLSVAFDRDSEHPDSNHLAAADKYCRLAILHGGQSKIRSAMLDEINELKYESVGTSDATFSDWDDIYTAFPGREMGEQVVAHLNRATTNAGINGRYHIAARLNARALLIARKCLGPTHYLQFATCYSKAQILHSFGRSQDALDEIEQFAPLELAALTPEHLNVLTTRNLKAQVLDSLGRFQHALDELEQFAPLEQAALTPNHPDVLITRNLKARYLNNLGRSQDALDEIEQFAPLQVAALTPNHPDIFGTRYQRAQIFNDLGRSQDALDEIEQFAPLQVAALAPNHPEVLATRNLKADTLYYLKRYQDALDELEGLAALQISAFHPDHAGVINTNNLRDLILQKLKP